MFVGIDDGGLGDTPAERRRRLAALEDAALAERMTAMALALRADAALHRRVADAASLPVAEVVASPFALRAVAMGVAVGATSRHAELRLRLDWPEAIEGADAVRDPDHGVWDRGALKTGKYQGFMADEPFAAYDPSHVAKWGPHELMHRAAGFLFRPGMTRWELYLGARLNELVPVVLFYGPEQAMRLDEGAFDRAAAGRDPAARLEMARWLDDGPEMLADRARRAAATLRDGVRHFERELEAIDEELRTGRRVRAAHPLLDASSDATAYVVGHHARLSSPAVASVLERVPLDARCDAPAAYRDRVEALFDRLLFAPLELDLDAAARSRRRREVWDVLLRAAHLGEGVEADLEPLLAAMDEPDPDPPRLRERLRAGLVDEEAAAVLEDGSEAGFALGQLALGVEQVAPCAWALLDDDHALGRLAASAELWDRAPLAARIARWLEAEGAPAAIRDMARLEASIVGARRDDGVERLGVPPDELPSELDDGIVVRSDAFDLLALDHDVLRAHAAFADGALERPEPAKVTLLVGGWFDGVAVVPLPDAVAAAWSWLEAGARRSGAVVERIDAALGELPDGWPQDGDAWVRELLTAGALGWRPR